MDRCAFFVDAGHLLAEGGRLCCGTANRSAFRCDFVGLTAALATFASAHCSLPLLRIYWYDAAPEAVPTQEQLAIADLPRVKLRLGRLVGNEQKGVDSLIVRDLMTLGRERAVATMFLLGGDEDLREGVVAAQEMGALLVVVGIPTTGRGNQAKSLTREADEHIMLNTASLSPYFTRADSPVAPEPIEDSPAPQASPSDLARLAGEEFAMQWARLARLEDLKNLIQQAPRIPTPLDVQLLSAVEEHLGSLRERKNLKKDLRAAFWKALKSYHAGLTGQ